MVGEALGELDEETEAETARALVDRKLRTEPAAARRPRGWSACWPARATRRLAIGR